MESFSSSGVSLWSRHIDGEPHSLGGRRNGDTVVVAGIRRGMPRMPGRLGSQGSLFVEGIRSADGASKWRAAVPYSGRAGVKKVVAGPDGDLIVVGWFVGSMGMDERPIESIEKPSIFAMRLDQKSGKILASSSFRAFPFLNRTEAAALGHGTFLVSAAGSYPKRGDSGGTVLYVVDSSLRTIRTRFLRGIVHSMYGTVDGEVTATGAVAWGDNELACVSGFVP